VTEDQVAKIARYRRAAVLLPGPVQRIFAACTGPGLALMDHMASQMSAAKAACTEIVIRRIIRAVAGDTEYGLKVQYRISEEDFIAAWLLDAWRGLLIWPSVRQLVAPAIIVILLIAGFIARPAVASFAAVILLLFASLYWIGTPYRAGRQYRRYKSIQEPQTVELFDDGLQFSSADGTSSLPWFKVFQWRQNARLVLIYKEPFLYHLIPKSVAQAGFDVELLVRRLAEHVGPER
jgi:hypothetical protein